MRGEPVLSWETNQYSDDNSKDYESSGTGPGLQEGRISPPLVLCSRDIIAFCT